MTTCTIDDATARLPGLVAKAAAGEDIVIAQENGDLVRLVPDEQNPTEPGPVTKAEIAWLRANRMTLAEPVDVTALVRDMRDEGH